MVADSFNAGDKARKAEDRSYISAALKEIAETLRSGTLPEIEEKLTQAPTEVLAEISLEFMSDNRVHNPHFDHSDYRTDPCNLYQSHIRPFRYKHNRIQEIEQGRTAKETLAAGALAILLAMTVTSVEMMGERQREVTVWRSDETRHLYLSSRPELASEFARQCLEAEHNAKLTAIKKQFSKFEGQVRNYTHFPEDLKVSYVPVSSEALEVCAERQAEQRIENLEKWPNNPAVPSGLYLTLLLTSAGLLVRGRSLDHGEIASLQKNMAERQDNLRTWHAELKHSPDL